MHLRPFRHGDEANLVRNFGLGWIGGGRADRGRVDPHGSPALHEHRLALVPIEAGNAWRAAIAHQLLVELCGSDGLRAVRLQLAVGCDGIVVMPEHEAGPDGRIGILETARDEAADAVGLIVELLRGFGQFVERGGRAHALLVQQLLIVHQHVVVKRERQRVDAAVRLRACLNGSLGEI